MNKNDPPVFRLAAPPAPADTAATAPAMPATAVTEASWLLLRRIGADELRTVKVMRGNVESQSDYAEKAHDGLPAGLFAQRLNSTPGKQDRLYCETKAGEPQSPAGPLLPWQRDLGQDTDKAAPAITQFNPDASWTPLAPES